MEIKELNKSYDEKKVVDNLSFEIKKGEVVSIIGPNGAGKSTLMSILSRLIKRDSGKIIFEDKDMDKWKSNELAKKIAILTQTNSSEMKLTVREIVSFGRFPYSANHLNEEDEKKVDEALEYMNLTEIQDKFIDELSGGQRQRAYIAMIIAQDTEYVLLDEPTNNLDVHHSTNLMRLVRKLSTKLGKTVILVLHEINFASFYSDYIIAMKDGKIAKQGKVQDVVTKENLKEIYEVDFEIMEINNRPMCIYF